MRLSFWVDHIVRCPEYAMAMDNVDAIVIGDGEQFLDIIQRVDQGEDLQNPRFGGKMPEISRTRTETTK